jgi:NIPSNAP
MYLKPYKFLQLSTLLLALIITLPVVAQKNKNKRLFYQLTIYQYSNAVQETMLNNYLQTALVPALHRMGIKQAGVFENLANDTATVKLIYLLLPLTSLNMVTRVQQKISNDKAYTAAADAYINTAYTQPAYDRIQVILLQAFALAPNINVPALKAAKSERVYELRSYESATEKIFNNKVKMFNEGDEIGLFKKLNFNAVFYSEVIAGGKMPNLMYMTSFENMADRDAHWKNFVDDPYWKKLSAMPEYQHNVSHIDISFLRPVEYADL